MRVRECVCTPVCVCTVVCVRSVARTQSTDTRVATKSMGAWDQGRVTPGMRGVTVVDTDAATAGADPDSVPICDTAIHALRAACAHCQQPMAIEEGAGGGEVRTC